MKFYRASVRRARGFEPMWALGPARAAPLTFPYHDHRTIAEVLADEARVHPIMPELYGRPTWIEQAQADLDEDNECQANAGDVHQEGQKTPQSCVEPVSRVAGDRSPAATPEIMDVTAGETALALAPGERPQTLVQTAPVVALAVMGAEISGDRRRGLCPACGIAGERFWTSCIEGNCPMSALR